VGAVGPGGDEVGICKQGLAHLSGNRQIAPRETQVGVLDETDFLHYVLDIEIDPANAWLGGTNTISVRSLIDGLSTVRIRLRIVLGPTNVSVDGVAASWQRLDNATIDITLPQTYDAGEEFEISVEYGGNPVSAGFGSINFTTQGGNPLVFTLSEPWFAHTWWPAKEDNFDKATGELKITVPDTMTVASNGLLLSVDPVGTDQLRYDWLTGYQTADYLFCFSAGVYNTWSETYVHDGGSTPVDFFIFLGSDNPGNRAAWGKCVDMLPVFSNLFGLFPFAAEKYGIYQFAFGGGMEHQTMTGQGTFSESVTAHELAHSWWGDMITCGTWQDIWLNEGFATYGEALWYEFEPGGGGEAALHAHMASRRPSWYGDSVYVPADQADNFNRIFSSSFSYRKGAWVLHQLRHIVGDEVFFDILAAYRAAFEYDSATTEDLRIVAEGVYGSDLTWFFDEWVYDIGAPEYRYGWRAINLNGEDWMELYVSQVQDVTWPIFTMPLDMQLSSISSQVTRVIWNDEQAEHFLVPGLSGVTGVLLDPLDWTLHKSNVEVSFVEGPPKVVTTTPEPGGSINAAEGMAIEIAFHKDVDVEAADLALVGDATGAASFSLVYDSLSYVATLTPDGPLPGDDYTLTVSDGVKDLAAGLLLDGELVDPADPASLPSGEGLPGGSAVVRFTVNPLGDLDGDGLVNVTDFLALLAAWGPCPGPCPPLCAGDLDGDCTVGVNDFLLLLAHWG
jgi:aminopeptidase N